MMSKPTHFERHAQLCILSVDDDPINLVVIEQLLAREGWRVRNSPNQILVPAAVLPTTLIRAKESNSKLTHPVQTQVVSAADGEEAQEFLIEEDSWPDFIFLDYQMNVGDSGDEVRVQRMGRSIGYS
jgi:CheY-like chemotaxis protein